MKNFNKYHKQNYADMEKSVLKIWAKDKTFQKSVANRSQDNSYVFYDGPPFITGMPHHGTLLPSIAKDVIPRYQTMKGKRVERRWGWDCHGLPAENFVEKKLGIKDKTGVYEVGLEKYINTCRESMIQTGSEWEDTIERIGRWVEFKGAYKTMDKEYMESVWWAFKQLYEKGKIYQGEKVLMYCTRCATPVSKAEIAMDNSYQDVTDPSVYVKFQLNLDPVKVGYKEDKKIDKTFSGLINKSDQIKKITGSKTVYLLAWTTTPWTLHANTALALNTKLKYQAVEYEEAIYIVAQDLVEKIFTDEKHRSLDYNVIGSIDPNQLIGLDYLPIFANRGKDAHLVHNADYVTTEEGTGIVHLAPAYGEEDYELAQANGIPLVQDIDENGAYTQGPWQGAYVWDINKQIAKELKEQGVVFKIDYVRHQYPHCHRCGTKLMYRAHPSWFMDIDGQKSDMIATNQDINWWPNHVKEGRFKHTVESAPDWNLSRDRFWATPMPIWEGTDKDGNQLIKIVGSYEELKQLSGKELEDYHRPWIDDIEFELNGVKYKRIEKVMDCWFESGSMPFAQFHYPFENKEVFERSFPADFIVEYVGQVRAWFYYLHAVSVGIFKEKAFKNVVVTGTISGNDGRKMSKSFGNFTDPMELLNTYSADAYRILLMSSPLLNGEDFALQDKDVADMQRKLNTLRSSLEFFLLYAEADGWQATEEHLKEPKTSNLLDDWVLARLNQTGQKVADGLDNYDVQSACRPITEFIDDLSNWYVRRNRKRFWKSENDVDKSTAYHTLYFVLTTFAHIIAPITPFIAEEIYHQLVDDKDSVHLQDYPKFGKPDVELIDVMHRTRRYITDGLSLRAQNQIKVRQPLSELTIHDEKQLPPQYIEIIAEEMNVKAVHYKKSGQYHVELDCVITDELRDEGFVREVVRFVQELRKKSGLEVSDKIELNIGLKESWVNSAVNNWQDYIKGETLATNLKLKTSKKPEILKTMGTEVAISLQKHQK